VGCPQRGGEKRWFRRDQESLKLAQDVEFKEFASNRWVKWRPPGTQILPQSYRPFGVRAREVPLWLNCQQTTNLFKISSSLPGAEYLPFPAFPVFPPPEITL